MIRLRQHIPGFIDTGRAPEEGRFETTADALACEWVARWRAHPYFHRFSCARENGAGLMAELENGYRFFVVAYVLDGDLDLPEWIDPLARLATDSKGSVDHDDK